MMNDASIRCRYAKIDEIFPNGDTSWLTPSETQTWSQMRSAERRSTWLAGRVHAKRLLLELLNDDNQPTESCDARDIEIESRSADGRLGVRPRVLCDGRPLEVSLSIAHTERGVLAAATLGSAIVLGVDLVLAGAVDRRALGWCFSEQEIRWLAAANKHDCRVERLWSMKEAVFKACHAGEAFSPVEIDVMTAFGARREPTCRLRRLQTWRIDGHVAALAVAAQCDCSTNESREPMQRSA